MDDLHIVQVLDPLENSANQASGVALRVYSLRHNPLEEFTSEGELSYDVDGLLVLVDAYELDEAIVVHCLQHLHLRHQVVEGNELSDVLLSDDLYRNFLSGAPRLPSKYLFGNASLHIPSFRRINAL